MLVLISIRTEFKSALAMPFSFCCIVFVFFTHLLRVLTSIMHRLRALSQRKPPKTGGFFVGSFYWLASAASESKSYVAEGNLTTLFLASARKVSKFASILVLIHDVAGSASRPSPSCVVLLRRCSASPCTTRALGDTV